MTPSLARRHRLLVRLLELSRIQCAALHDGDIDGFIAVLDRREPILRELAGVNGSRDEQLLPSRIAAVDDDNDGRVAIGLLVAAVLQQDEENERRLREEMERIRTALLRIGRGRTAARGYAVALPERQLGRAFDVVR